MNIIYTFHCRLSKILFVERVIVAHPVTLCLCFRQAETRAEFAERTVAKLEKSIDDLEGMRPVQLGLYRT